MLPTLFYALGLLIYWLSSFALIVLFGRMILDWIVFFSPHWRPQGLILLIANLINGLTDPGLRLLRRRIPPLRLGGQMALDIGFLILFGLCLVGQRIGGFFLILGA